ncbi:MAG: serine/threonine protein kinase, partial [Gemmataceae bacterium]|nr:serine/threonine protein kinase [Gemmataceae bacterium]
AVPHQPLDGTLGDFRLLREIGRGGMGVVYEAEQISLGRRVALKVLPVAATLDSRQMQRFENEARAAAHLHHGHIVPVFAVGRERGVPYYAMQYIEGRSLATVLDGLRHAPPSAETVAGASSLTAHPLDSPAWFREVASLGKQAAEALDHAHGMGVVHRDIKPANLLLDERGKLWVTDFGLARFAENPGATLTGDLVGTLRYMSPEQASGQPVTDPRSDVYGLGATLYELLVRRPAIDATDRQQCLRQILEEEPAPPRRLNRAVPPELETIVLKAMAKGPEDRYRTAGELADDLGLFLADRPIRARPPSLWTHAAKWARRHSRAMALAALGLAAAVVVLAVTAWRVSSAEARMQDAYGELEKEQAKTKAALAKEAAQRDRAEKSLAKAREVLGFLNGLGHEELGDAPAAQALRRRLLAKLLDYYQDFIDHSRDDPSVAVELDEARVQVSELLAELGKKAEALAAWEKAMRDRPAWTGGPMLKGPRGPESSGLPRGIARLFLLGQKAVQAELGLSAGQASQVRKLLGFGGRPPSNDEAAAAEKGLADVLKEAQATRLEEIIRQVRGPHALLDPETASALKLSGRQVEQVQAVLYAARRPEGRGPGRPPSMRQAEEKALKVLDSRQLTLWRGMQGKPFRGEFRFPPRPGPR